MEKENPGNIFSGKQENIKKCYHELKPRIFSILGRGYIFYFLIMSFSFSHFPPHHRKWALLEKCISIIPDQWKKWLFWKCSFSMLAPEMHFEKLFPISFPRAIPVLNFPIPLLLFTFEHTDFKSISHRNYFLFRYDRWKKEEGFIGIQSLFAWYAFSTPSQINTLKSKHFCKTLYRLAKIRRGKQ